MLKDSIGVPHWGNYIREMSQHGITWGDEATLLAASVLFKARASTVSQYCYVYCYIHCHIHCHIYCYIAPL